MQLYRTHLKAAQEWGSYWNLISASIHKASQVEMEKKHHTTNQKLAKLESTQTTAHKLQKKFYPRVINKTNIDFSTDELALLYKSLKYNLDFKRKDWIKNLVLEAEAAVTLLPNHEQDYVRIQVAHNVKQLYKHYSDARQCINPKAKRKRNIINKVKANLTYNKALILKADKGNSIVITYTDEYNSKVQQFIDSNNFTIMDKDPTTQFEKRIRTIINESPATIDKHKKAKYINLNIN
jgi:hypothetical protein